MKMIELNESDYGEFKAAYERAVAANLESFLFRGDELPVKDAGAVVAAIDERIKEQAGRHRLCVDLADKALADLAEILVCSKAYIAKRENGEPMFADDVAMSVQIARVMEMVATGLLQSSADGHDAVRRMIRDYHDCDKCSEKGNCSEEEKMRNFKNRKVH